MFESFQRDKFKTMKQVRETSDDVCRIMLYMLNLNDDMNVLEPSAGTGKIIVHIETKYLFKGVNFDLVELNKEKFCHLETLAVGKPNWNVFNADFLKFEPKKQYDRIIAAPPFKANVDVLHIQKMFTHLEKRGIMVSLTSPYWLINNEPHQTAFREWLTLNDKEYFLRMLPDNSFIEKGRGVPTAILQIFKK